MALASLTNEQRDALRLASQGFTSKQIARELGISHFAVDTRLDRARAALGAASRSEAGRMFRTYEGLAYDPPSVADTYDTAPLRAVGEEQGAAHRLNDGTVDLQTAVPPSWRIGDGPLVRTFLILLCAIGIAVAAQVAFGLFEAGNPAALRLVRSIRSLF